MERKERINKLIEFLATNYPKTQLFEVPCRADDYQEKVYEDGDIEAWYAPGYDYIDIYGITRKEYCEFVGDCECIKEKYVKGRN